MKQVITFHSYKGGTGKTTLAANLAALLAKNGNNVCIVDIDVYAPSLHAYFSDNVQNRIKNTINDYIVGGCGVDDLLVEITPISQFSDKGSLSGKIMGCFSSPKREDILKIEGVKEDKNRMNMLKRFINFREELIEKNDIDYIIMDSSPGIRFWAINALALSDIVFLTLKMGDMDIGGTKMIANEILAQFKEQGNTKYYLLLNRIAGYCIPYLPISETHPGHSQENFTTLTPVADDFVKKLTLDTGIDVMTSIPCYCDIQFAQKEFLTVLGFPDHPFSQQIYNLKSLIEN
ncbi:ParA family protein [Armatimonadetes bacterium]|nr:ParA family protein [bacterium]